MKHLRILVAAGMLAGAPLTAHASTFTTTLTVSAMIPGACTSFSATPLSFGSVLPTSTSYSTATIAVNCGAGTGFAVSLDQGTHGSNGNRFLRGTGTGTLLYYALFQDAARTMYWGDGTFGSVLNGSGTGGAQSLTIYGLTGNQPGAPTDSYTDTVTATLTF